MKRLMMLFVVASLLLVSEGTQGEIRRCKVNISNPDGEINELLSSATSWSVREYPNEDGVVALIVPIGITIQVKILDESAKWTCDDTKSGDVPILANDTELRICFNFNGLRGYQFRANYKCKVSEVLD
jgi:hypothetical protein